MAGVFKSLDKADVRITPFATYKLWSDTIESGGSGSIYSVYQADYNPLSNYLNADPLKDTFDQGNPSFDQSDPATINGKYKRVVHKSIEHLFYRDYLKNNMAFFGDGDVNNQVRFLEDQAYVISMPQSKFGESILQGSVDMYVSWSFGINSGSLGSIGSASGTWHIVDDIHGNLLISGSEYYSPYGQYIGGAYTNYTASVTIPIVGEWPFDETYKYTDIGPINVTSSYNRGSWQMQSVYKNTSVSFYTGSKYPNPSDLELLGAAMHFTTSLSSSIELKTSVQSKYNQYYNFENKNYSVSMMIRPTQLSTHVSGSVLLVKNGNANDLRIDINGNVYTVPVTNNYPYKLSITSGSHKLKFEKEGGGSLISITSSLSMSLNNLYHIALTRSSSIYTLYVNGIGSSSVDSINSTAVVEKHSRNQANIFIGNNYSEDQGFNGLIDNVKIYNDVLTTNDLKILHHTLGVGNTQIGNIYYSHGMMVLSSIPARYSTIQTVSTRGTHTIWENEVSCTIAPGDFNMSFNPTLQEYDPLQNEFVFKSFVTGSYFKPYITTIGLYSDTGQLVVIGKLSTPIQTPRNTDATFLVRFDR